MENQLARRDLKNSKEMEGRPKDYDERLHEETIQERLTQGKYKG